MASGAVDVRPGRLLQGLWEPLLVAYHIRSPPLDHSNLERESLIRTILWPWLKLDSGGMVAIPL
jgi:hypothetical protein